jgi:hypothetical protein
MGLLSISLPQEDEYYSRPSETDTVFLRLKGLCLAASYVLQLFFFPTLLRRLDV